MSVLETIVRIVAPHVCLQCGREDDALLCDDCEMSLIPITSRCYRCHVPSVDFSVCRACSDATPLTQVVPCFRYDGVARQLVHKMKYGRARGAADEIGVRMARHSTLVTADTLLVHAPTATSRVRMRGYDQAALIARTVARQTQCGHDSLLMRLGQKRQVGANRAQRARQLEDAFRIRHPERVSGTHIVLIDDVLTTGATLEAAARILLAAGASQVDALVFAQA
jgi:ComF family protein